MEKGEFMAIAIKHTNTFASIVLICLTVSSCTSSKAFPWDKAEVTEGVLLLNAATDLTYRTGFILRKSDPEVAVSVNWSFEGEATFKQELIREAAGGPARVWSTGDAILLVEWPTPAGRSTRESLARRCWQLDVTVDRFFGVQCPASEL